ncbi:MAG TPA: hypothetical protein VFK85_15480 [Anaeromyxobacteraceae bacterium]|nr:hypothetical protein [Anaeromyxobacteraceae bacterium]
MSTRGAARIGCGGSPPPPAGSSVANGRGGTSATSMGASRRIALNIGGRSANHATPAAWTASENARAVNLADRPVSDTVV